MRAASGRLWIAWVASSLAFLLAACPGGVVEVPDAGDGADAGEDGGPDAGEDAGPDAGEDAGPDAGEDAGPDAGEDADGAVDPPTCWDAIPPLDEVAFWVAPDGDDQADGSQATPFRSLERARQAVRVRLDAGDVPAGGLTVVLRGGDYPMATGVRLEAADSGPDAARPVRYRGHPGERARLTGAAPLEPAWFAPLEAGDPDHARLPEAARAEVRVVDLTAHGLSDHGTLRRRGFGTWGAVSALELYYQGEAMELARWPNRGQTDPPEPAHPARVRGDLFGAGVDFAYLGTAGVGNADDGYPAYAGQAAGRTFYLYHCTWEWGGATHRYWWVSEADPRVEAACWPSDRLAWGGSGTAEVPLLDVLFGGAAEPLVCTTQAEDRAQDGFVRIPEVASETRFRLPGARHQAWAAEPEPWFQGLFHHLWADDTLPGAVGADGWVELGARPAYGVAVRQPMAALNLLSELDSPGEWYLDRSSGRLFFWPPGPLAGAELRVSLLEEPLLRLEGAAHLVLEDLTLEGVRGRLLEATGVEDLGLERLVLTGAGGDAVRLRGREIRLLCSRVRQTGGLAVSLEGGHRPDLTPSGSRVADCEIERFGRWDRTYHPALSLAGCGHTVEHNHLHHAPHTAILFSGNDHLIRLNEIDHVVHEANDAGAIYAGRDWGYRGTHIEHNWIHDVDSVFGGSHGVYLDDAVSGMRVFGNVFQRIHGLATQSGGGRDNLFENNIMVHLAQGAHSTDRRARTSNATPGDSWNLLGRLQAVFESYEHGAALDHQAEPWASAYPALAVVPDDWASIQDSHWQDPEGCVFSRNVVWDSEGGILVGTWGGEGALDCYAEVADNLWDEDPGFVDEAGGDLRLRPDSPALAIPGFQPIPWEQIGPR